MAERRNPDGSLSIGVLEDMDAKFAPVEEKEEPKEAPKKAKKTTKKK